MNFYVSNSSTDGLQDFCLFQFCIWIFFFFFFLKCLHAQQLCKKYSRILYALQFSCLILPCIYVIVPKFYRSNLPVHPEYYPDFTVHISNWFRIMFYQTFCKLLKCCGLGLFFLYSSPHGCILLTIEVAIYFFRALFIWFVSYYLVLLYCVFFLL